ncbi:hypothetical protein DLH72_01385 [Candidatus Gracilibacteria bacterium]|nr:MAG: hypothetical protein DLH72_01385 [Candidatus Gracilibacteria bacterium]
MKKTIIYILLIISLIANAFFVYNNFLKKDNKINSENIVYKLERESDDFKKMAAFYHPAFWDLNEGTEAFEHLLKINKNDKNDDMKNTKGIYLKEGIKFPLEIIFEETYETAKGKPWEFSYIDDVPMREFIAVLNGYLKNNIDKFSKENLETQKEIFEKAFNSISEKNFGGTASFDSIEMKKENLSNIINNINEKLKSL